MAGWPVAFDPEKVKAVLPGIFVGWNKLAPSSFKSALGNGKTGKDTVFFVEGLCAGNK